MLQNRGAGEETLGKQLSACPRSPALWNEYAASPLALSCRGRCVQRSPVMGMGVSKARRLLLDALSGMTSVRYDHGSEEQDSLGAGM